MTACIDLVRREIADITDKELDEVLEQLRARQARLIESGVDPATASAQAGLEVSETLKTAAAIEKRNALINQRIRLEALDYLRTTWGENPAEGVLALIYGSARSRFGSRASANAAQNALSRRYIGGVQGELEAAGLFDVLARGELDKDVFRAMRSLNDEKALRSMPEQAVAIAKILDRWQEVARIEANRAGGWIGKLDDYGLRQAHNADRIMRAGEAKWKADIAPKLDLPRMFPEGPPKDLDAWLHETFLNIVTGVRERSTSERMAAFKGPGNLAKKLSQERVLHFKSADDAFDYNTDYGMGNIRETFVAGMHRMAESTGLMQVLGTNPEHNLQAIVDNVRSDLARKDPAALKKFENDTRNGVRIDNAYKEVSGQTRRAASARLAAVGQGVRVLNTLTGLGGTVLSAITDVPMRASLLRHQGQSYLQQLGKGLIDPLTRLTDRLDSADRKAVLSAAGYFNEIALGNLAARFSPDDTIPGALNKATNTFFKFNLLAQWTDSMRRSTLEAMAHYWGSVSTKAWGDLSERNRAALERFRIGEQEWQVISQGTTEADGQRFLTPQAVREMPREHFTDLAADRINALKVGLVERLKRRAAADERDAGWVAKRSQNLRDELARANERLADRLSTIDSRGAAELRDIQEKLAGLYGHLDTSGSYWAGIRDRAPRIGEMRQQGMKEARALAQASEAQAIRKRIAKDLDEVKGDLDAEFVERWLGKEGELEKRLARLDDLEGDARRQQFEQLFTEANAALTARVEKLEDVAAARVSKALERLGRAETQFSESAKFWQRMRDAQPRAGEMRSAGVSEGRARESAKNLKADARQVGRDLARLKKELQEDFVDRWSERQDELVEFAERSEQRIRERGEASARDIANLDPQVTRILDDTRAQTADRLQQFYADDLDSAVIAPDARTLSFIRQGQQAGTPIGEALRLFWQFKSFGIAVMQRAFLRELHGYGPKFGIGQIRGLGLLMLGSLGFGYAAMTLKDLVKGKKPRPIDSVKTWSAAMAQGGGLGIYGDFLFGEANRMGGGFLETLGGPTVGKLADAKRLFDAVKNGDDAAAQALRFVISNTPGNNLFYARMAADYLFLYELQEAMNPGYLRRMERKAEQERGQQWWLRPSETVN